MNDYPTPYDYEGIPMPVYLYETGMNMVTPEGYLGTIRARAQYSGNPDEATYELQISYPFRLIGAKLWKRSINLRKATMAELLQKNLQFDD